LAVVVVLATSIITPVVVTIIVVIITTITLSVRNVVPTLTSNERQGLSLNGRC
jgi:hypothetical protein